MTRQSMTVGRKTTAAHSHPEERRYREVRNSIVSFTFHTENVYASGRQKRPRGPRSMYSHRYLSSPKPRPSYGPFTFRQEAHAFFVVYHLQGLNDIAPVQHQDESLEHYVMSRNNALLDKAVSSLSLAVFARSRQCRAAAIEATTEYQVLLQLMQKAITSLHPTDLEPCLLAVLFVSLYEDAVYVEHRLGPLEHHHTHGGKHTAGMIALLKRWKDLNGVIKSPAAVKHARRQCIKSALTRQWAIPDWLWDGEEFGEQGPSLDYDRIVVRTYSARQRLSKLRESHTTEEVQSLLEDLRRFDIQLQSWTLRFPVEWRCTKSTLSDCGQTPNPRFFSPQIHTYDRPADACPWIRYYAMRVLICSLRLDALKLDMSTYDTIEYMAYEQELLATMKSATIDMASALPFAMGRLALSPDEHTWKTARLTGAPVNLFASGLITPVVILSGIRHLDPTLRNWFKTQIVELGKVLGYGLLAAVAKAVWLVI